MVMLNVRSSAAAAVDEAEFVCVRCVVACYDDDAIHSPPVRPSLCKDERS